MARPFSEMARPFSKKHGHFWKSTAIFENSTAIFWKMARPFTKMARPFTKIARPISKKHGHFQKSHGYFGSTLKNCSYIMGASQQSIRCCLFWQLQRKQAHFRGRPHTRGRRRGHSAIEELDWASATECQMCIVCRIMQCNCSQMHQNALKCAFMCAVCERIRTGTDCTISVHECILVVCECGALEEC